MDKVYTSHESYFTKAFGDLEEMADNLQEALGSVEYDTLVGTGLSGTLVVPGLARILGKYWAIVRKEVSPHSSTMIQGEIGHKWLFVDDFISSGDTYRRVRDTISEKLARRYNSWTNQWEGFETVLVGSYEYEKYGTGQFTTFARYMDTY